MDYIEIEVLYLNGFIFSKIYIRVRFIYLLLPNNNMKIKILAICLLLTVLIAGCVQAPSDNGEGEDITPPQDTDQNDEVFCTQDVYQCPDGSYVGRIPPTCEYADCPESDEGGVAVPSVIDVSHERAHAGFTVSGTVTNIGQSTGDADVVVTLFDNDQNELAKKTIRITSIQPNQIKSFTAEFDLTHEETIEVMTWTAVAKKVY
jgi:hypothetical protein